MEIPTVQTAVQITSFNAADWLSTVKIVNDAVVPKPAAGQVLVKVQLRPINPADVFSMMGVYPAFNKNKKLPCVPGMEGMGVVAALGEGVTGFTVGQRVIPYLWPNFAAGDGMFQEYILLPAKSVAAVPDDITDDAAACAIINPVSVLGMLDIVGPVPAGRYVVITAAGSALGKMLIKVCKARGIKTIGLVRRAAHAEELLQYGADAMIVNTSEDVLQRVMEITGGAGAYAAFDSMWGTMAATLCQAVETGGTVVEYGAMEGLTSTLSVADVLFRAVKVAGYWMQIELEHMTPEQREKRLQDIWQLYRDGTIVSGAETVLPLDRALEAFQEHVKEARPHKILLSSK